MVERYEAEQLLEDKDAEDLGFIIFNKKGRGPTPEECSCSVNCLEPSIPQKLCGSLRIAVDTKPQVEISEQMSTEGKENIEKLVTRYKGSVFYDTKIGCMKVPPVHLDYETDFKPRQPPFRNIPFFYQESQQSTTILERVGSGNGCRPT